jgi:type II secretory pathway pseudopilin PulG
MLATVAVVSLAGTVRAARAQDAAEQVAFYDRATREWARRFGRTVRLSFDLDRGTVSRAAAGDDAGDRPAALHLASGFRIERVVWPGGSATAGQASVAVSSRGQTPSYAVLLRGNGSKAGAERHWLVVAGLTGRTTAVNDDREVEDLFRTLAGEATADGPTSDDAR